jgi:hypothetical protein
MQKIIFDRLCEFGLPFDVCSSPKATYLLRGNEMTRRADFVEKGSSCGAELSVIQSV